MRRNVNCLLEFITYPLHQQRYTILQLIFSLIIINIVFTMIRFQCHGRGRHLMCSFQFHTYIYICIRNLIRSPIWGYGYAYVYYDVYHVYVRIFYTYTRIVIASEEFRPPSCADRNVMLKNIDVFDEGSQYSRIIIII